MRTIPIREIIDTLSRLSVRDRLAATVIALKTLPPEQRDEALKLAADPEPHPEFKALEKKAVKRAQRIDEDHDRRTAAHTAPEAA